MRFFGITSMFLIVTIDAEEFPVAPIERIVLVIVVFVMNSEIAQSFAGKFATASAANMRKQFECAVPISGSAKFLVPLCFCHYLIQSPAFLRGFSLIHSVLRTLSTATG